MYCEQTLTTELGVRSVHGRMYTLPVNTGDGATRRAVSMGVKSVARGHGPSTRVIERQRLQPKRRGRQDRCSQSSIDMLGYTSSQGEGGGCRLSSNVIHRRSCSNSSGDLVVYNVVNLIPLVHGWLGSRVVSMLDSGAEGPGSNRSRDAVG